MKFTIEENLPIPRPNVQWDFPVDSIKVGQALVVMCEDEDGVSRTLVIQGDSKCQKRRKISVSVSGESSDPH